MITTTTVRVTNGRRRFLRDLSLLGGAALLSPGGLFGDKSVGAQEVGAPPSASAVQPDRKTQGGRGSSMRIRDEIMEYRDEETGARVCRLTGDGSDNVHLYFTSESFLTGPANRLVFASNRSGRFQFHLLDIEAAKLVQVTDGEDLSPVMACPDPAGRLFYFDGPVLRSVALDTLEDRELYRVPEGVRPGLPSCTADGRYVAFAYSEVRVVSTETGRIYSTMAKRYYQHPSCVIMRIDTANGQVTAAWGERAWISHGLVHPSQPDLILFCHEGGSHVSQRMWTVDVSTVRGRQAKQSIRSGQTSSAFTSISHGRAKSVFNTSWTATGNWSITIASSARTGRGSGSTCCPAADRGTSNPIRTTRWSSVTAQYHMIHFVKQAESKRAQQHPVGMTGAPIGTPELMASPADWISPPGKTWLTDPPANPGGGDECLRQVIDTLAPFAFHQGGRSGVRSPGRTTPFV